MNECAPALMRPLVLLALVCACSTPSPSTTPTYYRDVSPIVQQSCQGCHVTSGIAPFPLETFEQVKAQATSIAAAVQSRRMPPWMPAEGCGQPFVGDFHLDQTEIDTLVAWAQDPAEGSPADAPAAAKQSLDLPRIDASLAMPEAYTPSETLTDDYRCFVIDPHLESTKFVTGYNIAPGVTAEVHHVILYTAKRADAEAADAKDPAPGWPCFGGAGVDLSGALGAWAPGTGAVRYPGGTGLALGVDQVIAMQIHYNTRAGTRVPDQTRAELMFAERPVTGALLLPLPADGFEIPPRTMGYQYTQRFANVIGISFDVWGLLPHMHTRGKSITLRTDDACLVSIPKWDFQWQRVYFRTTAMVVPPNGGLSLDCTWDNPDDVSVRWGERTSDEMCFAFVYATPH